jgi:PiT family inorganic phosphate transporter
VIVVLVVGAALSFDFTNGFHDTANAMATTIATGRSGREWPSRSRRS